MKHLLGTVCKLKGIDLEILIIGYEGKSASSDYVYEYTGCLLNEGFINSEKLYRFNGEHIETILYEGYNKNQTSPQASTSMKPEIEKEQLQDSTSNSDKEEYVFDENGVLIEIKKPKQTVTETTPESQSTSAPVTLESIDINSI